MTSPLLPYANGRILVPGEGTVSLVNGRWVESGGGQYLVKLFVKRQQYSGVSSGSRKLPLESQLDGNMMPGVSGDQFYYRGYSLEYAAVSADFEIGDDESAIGWLPVTQRFSWMNTGEACKFRIGTDPVMNEARIQRASGQFGGEGIDTILYSEIGGVEIQITGGEIQV